MAVINASLSGPSHITYHTVSVEDTLLRLTAMGLDLNLIAGTLKAIVNKSNSKTLCDECKIKSDSGFTEIINQTVLLVKEEE